MKSFLLFTVCVFTINFVKGQNSNDMPTWAGRWSERQTETSATEWLFQGKNQFAKITYWAASELGGRIHKGTFQIDTVKKMVILKFDRVVDIENDTVLSTGYHEEWKIISMANNELVLSRGIVFSTDRPNKNGDKENIYVRLARTMKYTYTEPTARAN